MMADGSTLTSQSESRFLLENNGLAVCNGESESVIMRKFCRYWPAWQVSFTRTDDRSAGASHL
jgi:hypothetical protein